MKSNSEERYAGDFNTRSYSEKAFGEDANCTFHKRKVQQREERKLSIFFTLVVVGMYVKLGKGAKKKEKKETCFI